MRCSYQSELLKIEWRNFESLSSNFINFIGGIEFQHCLKVLPVGGAVGPVTVTRHLPQTNLFAPNEMFEIFSTISRDNIRVQCNEVFEIPFMKSLINSSDISLLQTPSPSPSSSSASSDFSTTFLVCTDLTD